MKTPILCRRLSRLTIVSLCLLFGSAQAATPNLQQNTAQFSRQSPQQQITSLSQRVSKLEALLRSQAQLNSRLNQLLGVLLVNGNTVTLKSSGKLKLESAQDTSIKSSNSIKLEAANSQDLKAAQINIKATATTSIKGSVIKLNNGSKMAARVTSNVSGNKIITGSTTVFVP